MHSPTSLRSILLATSAMSAMLLPGAYALVGAGEVGGGALRSFAYAQADDLITTTSTTFVPMPDMSVDFTIADTDRLVPIVIHFSGAANTLGTGAVLVQAVVDGVPVPFARSVQLAASSTRFPHSFTWVASNLLPGRHTIEIHWMVTMPVGGASTGVVAERSLVVEGR